MEVNICIIFLQSNRNDKFFDISSQLKTTYFDANLPKVYKAMKTLINKFYYP